MALGGYYREEYIIDKYVLQLIDKKIIKVLNKYIFLLYPSIQEH